MCVSTRYASNMCKREFQYPTEYKSISLNTIDTKGRPSGIQPRISTKIEINVINYYLFSHLGRFKAGDN